MDWLHTEGVYVKDAQGRTVAMRMIANFPWHMSRQYAEIDKEAFIQNCKAHGINAITLGFRTLETDEGLGWSFDFETQISEWDAIVNLCKQHGVYVVLNYAQSSTGLERLGIERTAQAHVDHLIQVWTPIIEHYKNEPTVVGVRVLDEPHLATEEEVIFWRAIIGQLRQINPKLLWFAHTITELRFGTQYWYLIPYKKPEDVPYPNILMDGGIWISEGHPPYDFAEDDHDGADALFNDVIARMAHFRDLVQIPTGITVGIDERYPANNARSYFLAKIHRWMEENGYILTLYAADYELEPDGLACLNEVFPDVPYPEYWAEAPVQLSASMVLALIIIILALLAAAVKGGEK